jgi:uncharacterized membrane protein
MSWLHGSEAHHRSLVKAITWRITGSIDTFLITFIVTGRLVLAGSIAGVEVITKVALYYLHERMWLIIPLGRASNESRNSNASPGSVSLNSGFGFGSLYRPARILGSSVRSEARNSKTNVAC